METFTKCRMLFRHRIQEGTTSRRHRLTFRRSAAMVDPCHPTTPSSVLRSFLSFILPASCVIHNWVEMLVPCPLSMNASGGWSRTICVSTSLDRPGALIMKGEGGVESQFPVCPVPPFPRPPASAHFLEDGFLPHRPDFCSSS